MWISVTPFEYKCSSHGGYLFVLFVLTHVAFQVIVVHTEAILSASKHGYQILEACTHFPAMQVFLTSACTGTHLMEYVESDDSVYQLLVYAERFAEGQIQDFRLLYNGQMLYGPRSLGSYGIGCGSVVLVERIWRITLRCLDSWSDTSLVIFPWTTVRDIKIDFSNRLGIEEPLLTMIFVSERLNDEARVNEIGVVDGDTLHITAAARTR
jgi:hypothetical protein